MNVAEKRSNQPPGGSAPLVQSRLIEDPLAVSMFRLGLPGVFGALIFSVLGMVEAGYLTLVGTEALAAVAIVFPLIMLAAMFSAGAIGGAVSGATARAIGSQNFEAASAVLVVSVLVAVVGGFLMTGLVLSAGPILYQLASDNPRVVELAQAYALVVFPAMPLFWLSNMLSSFLRGTGDMVRPALVALAMLVAYVIAAYFLVSVYGIGGESASAEKIQGAGAAMSVAYLASAAVACWFVLRPSQQIRFRLNAFDMSVFVAVLRQGLLASSQSLMTIVYTLVATILFSRFGLEWLAGYGLAVRLELIMVPVIFGIGSSLIAIVGVHVGAGMRARAISIAWKGVFANALIICAIGLLLAWKPEVWCVPLGTEVSVQNHCAQSLRILGPTYAFFALGLGCYFASQGLNTLLAPVAGALLRLLIVVSALFWVTGESSPTVVLGVVAFAIVAYGLFVVVALKLGPWSQKTI